MPDPAPAARIGGQPVPLAEAVARAAAILAAGRCAVVGGLLSDAAGTEAAVTLARRIGGVLDHPHAAAALRDLEVMRQEGWIVTTPLVARARADLVLLAGPGIADAWPGFADRLCLAAPPVLVPDRGRRVIALGAEAVAGGDRIEVAEGELAAALGELRALVAGRKLRGAHERLAECAAALAQAAYGVVMWSAAALDDLSIVQACGLVEDLNRKTRCAGLPLAPAECAAQVTAALTGFPLRVGFARNHAEHDPWRFDTARLIESGEADAALWIGAPDPVDHWPGRVPLVALAPSGAAFATPPEVEITVGTPGVDHDAILYDPDLGTLAARRASAPGTAPSAADVLRQITAALPC